jgi:hypothetical protein
MDNLSVLVDVQYALKQLRQFRDVGRAIDALERVEEALQRPAEDDKPEYVTDDDERSNGPRR